MKIKKIKNNYGYTYLDLMLSIAIIGILSAISIITFASYKNNSDVQIAALKLASDIRQTQNYALGLKEFNTSIPNGWGIHMLTDAANNGKYIIFADKNANFVYDTGNNESSSTINFGQAQINDITIDNVSGQSQINITFEPPNPTVHICTDAAHCNYQSARLELKGSASNNSATSSVSVNNLGLVEVN
jgi:Tfp pilus assembly protein FimT